MESLISLDKHLALLINKEWRTEWLSDFMPIFAGTPVFAICLLFVFIGFCWFKKKDSFAKLIVAIAFLGLSIGTADICAESIKKLTKRQRPYKTFPHINYLDKGKWVKTTNDSVPVEGRNYSFYSGHATNSMAFAAFTASIVPTTAPVVYAFAVIVGYSRVYVGKHYPLDVMVGLAVGFVLGKIFALFYRRFCFAVYDKTGWKVFETKVS